MSANISTTLTNLANEYYISATSAEGQKIDLSVAHIKERLANHFGQRLIRVIEFGSYRRDTILPRRYDNYSDVDLMVIFNTAGGTLSPNTYRTYLANFATQSYPRSEFYRTLPTVTLELDHIHYDLVPAYQNYVWWKAGLPALYIPESGTTWQETDPIAFNTRLTEANTRHGSQIKRVIRLFKAWNAKVGYPFESFKLEEEIVSMGFGGCTTLQQYFLFVIDYLSLFNRSANLLAALRALQNNGARLRNALDFGTIEQAKTWLAHILPM